MGKRGPPQRPFLAAAVAALVGVRARLAVARARGPADASSHARRCSTSPPTRSGCRLCGALDANEPAGPRGPRRRGSPSQLVVQQNGSNPVELGRALAAVRGERRADLAGRQQRDAAPPHTPCAQTPEQHAPAEPHATPVRAAPRRRCPRCSAGAAVRRSGRTRSRRARASAQTPATQAPLQHASPAAAARAVRDARRATCALHAAQRAALSRGSARALSRKQPRPQAPPMQTPAQHAAALWAWRPVGRAARARRARRSTGRRSSRPGRTAPSRAQLSPPQIPARHAALQVRRALAGEPVPRHTGGSGGGASGAPCAREIGQPTTSCSREPHPRASAARTTSTREHEEGARSEHGAEGQHGGQFRRAGVAVGQRRGRGEVEMEMSNGSGDGAAGARRPRRPAERADPRRLPILPRERVVEDRPGSRALPSIVRGRIRENLRSTSPAGRAHRTKGEGPDLDSHPSDRHPALPLRRQATRRRGAGRRQPRRSRGGSDDKNSPARGQAGSGEGDHLARGRRHARGARRRPRRGARAARHPRTRARAKHLERPRSLPRHPEGGPESLRHFKRTYREARSG